MAATADEEKGGTLGVEWLCKNRPDFQKVEAVINEGGGVGIARKTNNFRELRVCMLILPGAIRCQPGFDFSPWDNALRSARRSLRM